jgi:hypothetical protein
MTMHAGESADSLREGDPRRLGRYRMVGRLGQGGMGTVYLAEDAEGRRVAVKVINPLLAEETAFRDRFRREVEAAGRVRRFCTAPVVDADVDHDPPYIVTDFINGPSLERSVREHGALPGADLEGLAVGVATALAAIHGAGVVHRDLKPSNVLLSPTGPRVIDFGIARALDTIAGSSTRSGQIVGTPGYIAPELLRGEEVTPACDVFSWGCVVVYAGTGRSPFSGRNVPEILYRVAHEPARLDGLDEGLRDLVLQALDKDPLRRPPIQRLLAGLVGQEHVDPADLAETVQATWHGGERAGSSGATPTRSDVPVPPEIPAAGPAPTRRRRLVLALGAGGVAVAAVIAAVIALLPGDLPGGLGDSPPKVTKTIVRKDNFENIGSGWPNGPVDCGHYQDSAYRLAVRVLNSTATCDFPGELATQLPNRMLADVRVMLQSGPQNGQWSAGVYFLKDNTGRYDVVLRPDGTARLLKVDDDRGLELTSGKVSGFEKTGFNQVQAELDITGPGTRLALWVNGHKTLEFTDTDSPRRAGTTGLVLNRPAEGSPIPPDAEASFDDYTLWEVGG